MNSRIPEDLIGKIKAVPEYMQERTRGSKKAIFTAKVATAIKHMKTGEAIVLTASEFKEIYGDPTPSAKTTIRQTLRKSAAKRRQRTMGIIETGLNNLYEARMEVMWMLVIGIIGMVFMHCLLEEYRENRWKR